MMTRLIICVAFFILLFCSPVLFRTVAAESSLIIGNQYHPNIEYIGRDFRIPPDYPFKPDSWIDIYARINDKYGKIEQAILSYKTVLLKEGETCKIQTPWNNITMRLIDGSPSNGTYAAEIPPQTKNTIVYYFAHFKDDLNYTSSSTTALSCQRLQSYYVSGGESTIKKIEFIHNQMEVYKPIVVRALLLNITGIRNVILRYAITNESITPTKFTPIKMEWNGTSPDTNISYYQAKIPISKLIHEKNKLWLFSNITMSDYEGNIVSQTTFPRAINFIDIGGIKNFNKISLNTTVSNLDMSNRTAEIQIRSVEGYINTTLLPNPVTDNLSMTVHYPPSSMIVAPSRSYTSSQPAPPYPLPLFIANVDNNIVKNYSFSSVQASEDERAISHLFRNASLVQAREDDRSISRLFKIVSGESVSFALTGDPSSFPFDHYLVNLLFVFPLKDITTLKFNYATFFDKAINSSWNPSSYDVSLSDTGKFIDQYRNIIHRIPIINETLSGTDRHYRLLNYLHIELSRNYAISALVLPIFAIFYLLGAVFIFENSDISNRLVLTVGVFALIFSLPQIISSMKPTTSVPTIADSLYSIIIFATIAFTISSVISISSTVQKRFPKHYEWADGLVFILVSIIVIVLIGNYDPSITVWLIPVILIGLGYGLLIRVLIRVSKQKFRASLLCKRNPDRSVTK